METHVYHGLRSMSMKKDDESIILPCPEPVEIKKKILELRSRMGPEINPDSDSLAVWYGNRVLGYLWTECRWKTILGKKGCTWQRFLKLMRYHTTDMVSWMAGRISWDEFVRKLIEDVKSELEKGREEHARGS